MGHAFQLLRLVGEREQIFDVRGADRIVGQLLLALLAWPEPIRLDPQLGVPRLAHVAPILVPLHGFRWMTEELDLHLLELAATERVVARIDLIAERLADLGDTERQLEAGAVEDVLE